MSTLSKHLFAALLGTAIISSCSRPVAYFQPQAREQFKSTPVEAVAVATPVQPVEASPVETPAPALVATPAEQVAQAKQAISQVEAYVRNDSKLASNKKLTKRMERLNQLLTTTSTKATLTPNAASTQKTTLMQRMMLKKLDKKIKNHVAPEETKVMSSNMRLGLIIGLVGLLLWILGGGTVLGVIGLIGFIVGIVLVILGLVNT
ncbi:hypothetical protein [Spirosoma validum]|uniref:Uncharacterized protein n=1 Tax=Spirosoma validum TaxID=2771355 RepID=A0A927AZW7_9BACT|nr:hypothetical protein [Spirosoma validum]MBD2752793.1 hypothetical protein [Spirosoma validum]